MSSNKLLIAGEDRHVRFRVLVAPTPNSDHVAAEDVSEQLILLRLIEMVDSERSTPRVKNVRHRSGIEPAAGLDRLGIGRLEHVTRGRHYPVWHRLDARIQVRGERG